MYRLVVNWPEIGIELGLIVLLLALVAVYVRYRALPKLKTDAGMWVGAAIGRFMQNLAEEAEVEGGGVPGTPGQLKIGGFQIDVGTIKELMGIAPQLIQLVKTFGLLSGGGGGGENPFLK